MVDSCTQTTGIDEDIHTEIDLDTEPLMIGGYNFGTSDYHDAYRDGNFGIKRGKINFNRAWKCSKLHMAMAVLIEIVSIILVCLIESNHRYWLDHDTTDTFAGLSITCGIVAMSTAVCSLYLVRYIATMKKPLFVLLLTRLLAFLECLLSVSTFITTLIAVSNSRNGSDPYTRFGDFYTPEPWIPHYYGLFVVLCILLLVLLIVDALAAMAWLFHWWRCCECCQLFKSRCIFEPGHQLAEGVPDPRTGILKECFYVCWAAYKSDWGTVI